MVLTVTEAAREKILELRAQEDDPESLGLRIEVTGVRGVEYTYDLTFDRVASADEAAGDVVEHQGDLPVIVPVDSVEIGRRRAGKGRRQRWSRGQLGVRSQ